MEAIPGIRVTRLGAANGVSSIRVEGSLTAASAAELARVCGEVAQGHEQRVLDATDLISIDEAGAEVIRALLRDGWRLAGASLFLRARLEESRS